jgi:hypothetical protein
LANDIARTDLSLLEPDQTSHKMKLVLAVVLLMYVARSLSLQKIPDADNLFNIGVGKADITGPAADRT